MKWDNSGVLWIGVDLDGTLAKLESELISPTYIGEPIKKMVDLVNDWKRKGWKVKIFTARVSPAWFKYVGVVKASKIEPAIQKWCKKNLGWIPEITCEKDHLMVRLYDDIDLIQIQRNTGNIRR